LANGVIDSRLRGNDSRIKVPVIPAKAGIQKTYPIK